MLLPLTIWNGNSVNPAPQESSEFGVDIPLPQCHTSVKPPCGVDPSFCWRAQVAVQEMRRLQRYGITPGELERYKTALLRDSEQLAEQARRPLRLLFKLASHRIRTGSP